MMRCLKKVAIVILAMAVLSSFLPFLSIGPLTSPAYASPVVSPDGWQWQNPLPQGNDLHSVWGSSATDVFVVGDAGTVLHYDGSAWSKMNCGTSANLKGVWGTS